MKFRVDWVSEDGKQFGVVAWSSDMTEAMGAYTELDAVPGSEGVFNATTEESALRARNQGSGKAFKIQEATKLRRAYFIRMVLPTIEPVAVNEELLKARVLKLAGA